MSGQRILSLLSGPFENVPATRVLRGTGSSTEALRHRYSLSATPIGGWFDDLGEMLIKRVRTFHNDAQQNLDEFNKQSRGRTEGLIALFRNFLGAYRSPGTLEERFRAMDNALGQEPDEVITQCDQVTVFADNNYISFMLPLYKRSRPALFSLVDRLDFIATTQDTALMTAIEFIRQMKSRRGDHPPFLWPLSRHCGQPLRAAWYSTACKPIIECCTL